MSSGKDKAKQTAMENQTAAAVAQTNVHSPAEDIANQRLVDWSQWEKKPGQDIMSAPGMSYAGDIYGNAAALAAKQKVGDPRSAFTANLPGFNNQLTKQLQENLYNTRAEGLSNSYSNAKADAMSAGVEGAQLQAQRANAYAGAQQNYLTSWYNRPQKPPLWQTILGTALGGVNSMKSSSGAAGLMAI